MTVPLPHSSREETLRALKDQIRRLEREFRSARPELIDPGATNEPRATIGMVGFSGTRPSP